MGVPSSPQLEWKGAAAAVGGTWKAAQGGERVSGTLLPCQHCLAHAALLTRLRCLAPPSRLPQQRRQGDGSPPYVRGSPRLTGGAAAAADRELEPAFPKATMDPSIEGEAEVDERVCYNCGESCMWLLLQLVLCSAGSCPCEHGQRSTSAQLSAALCRGSTHRRLLNWSACQPTAHLLPWPPLPLPAHRLPHQPLPCAGCPRSNTPVMRTGPGGWLCNACGEEHFAADCPGQALAQSQRQLEKGLSSPHGPCCSAQPPWLMRLV